MERARPHLSQGNSPLAAWEQLLLFGANPGWRNRLRCSWSEPWSSSSFLGKTASKGMLPGKQHGHPPGLSGACLLSSAALEWTAPFLLNLSLSPSGRASTLLQTSQILLMGLSQHLPGVGAPRGCPGATFTRDVGHSQVAQSRSNQRCRTEQHRGARAAAGWEGEAKGRRKRSAILFFNYF